MQDIRDYFMKEKKGDKRKITEGIDEIVIAYNKNNKENDVEGRGKAKKIKKKEKQTYLTEKEERNNGKKITEAELKENKIENENRLKYIDIEEGEEKENKNGDNSNKPMTIEVIMEKEPIRREKEKDDGFRVVTRKRRNKAFEKIGRVKGVFKDFKNMSEEEVEMVETKDQRFSGRQKEYVVTAKIKPEHITTDKRTNYVKIIKAILKDGIDPVNVLDNSFAASDIIFKDKEKANKCLSIEDKEERIITYGISNRTTQCRGVIISWDGDLFELSEAIEDKDQVIKVQRLRKRVWSVEEGEYGWEPTRHVIITLKGNRMKYRFLKDQQH